MTNIPIIFSGPMVRALLEGRKTMTRRLAWRDYPPPEGPTVRADALPTSQVDKWVIPSSWQKAKPGDRLYVREAWRTLHANDCLKPRHLAPDPSKITYEADPERRNPLWAFGKLRPSIHMPRWASRLTLEVTATKIERLQEIGYKDAVAEGIVSTWGDFMGKPPQWAIDSINRHGDASGSHIYDNRTSAENFAVLWESLHGAGSWDANPELVALSFRVHHANIDQMERAAA